MIASAAFSENEVAKIVELLEETARWDPMSLAAPQEPTGKLCFTQTASMGRFVRAALKPIYELVAKKEGTVPRPVKACPRWRTFLLPTIDPRLISSLGRRGSADTVKIYSDAIRAGKLVSSSFSHVTHGISPIS